MLIKQTIDRFEEISSIKDRLRSGCPCSSRTPNLIKSVKEKIRRNLRSMRKMAKEFKISPRTMCRICHDNLKISLYKLQMRQLIFGATIEKKLARSKLLLKRLNNSMLQNFIFTDEKLFAVQQVHNHQNDRVLAKL